MKRTEFCGHKAFYRIILITPNKKRKQPRPKPLPPSRAKTGGRDAHRRQPVPPTRTSSSSSVSAAAATALPSGQGSSGDLFSSPVGSPVISAHGHSPRLVSSAELVRTASTHHSSGRSDQRNTARPKTAAVTVVAEATLVDPFTSSDYSQPHAGNSRRPQPHAPNAQNEWAEPSSSSSAPPVTGRRYSFAEGRRNSFILYVNRVTFAVQQVPWNLPGNSFCGLSVESQLLRLIR